MFSSARARPNCVMPEPPFASGLFTRKTVFIGGWEIGGIQHLQSGSPANFGCATGLPGNSPCFRFSLQPGRRYTLRQSCPATSTRSLTLTSTTRPSSIRIATLGSLRAAVTSTARFHGTWEPSVFPRLQTPTSASSSGQPSRRTSTWSSVWRCSMRSTSTVWGHRICLRTQPRLARSPVRRMDQEQVN